MVSTLESRSRSLRSTNIISICPENVYLRKSSNLFCPVPLACFPLCVCNIVRPCKRPGARACVVCVWMGARGVDSASIPSGQTT